MKSTNSIPSNKKTSSEISSESPLLNLVVAFGDATLKNDDERVTNILSKIPIEKMDIDISNKLLIMLIKKLKENGQKHYVEDLFDHWEKYNNEEKLSVYAQLFKSFKTPDDILKFISVSSEILTALDLYSELLYFDRNYNYIVLFERIKKIFGKQTLSEYDSLINLCYESGNEVLVDYFKNMKTDLLDPAPIPRWIGNYEESNYLPSNNDIKERFIDEEQYSLPSREEGFELLIEHMDSLGQLEYRISTDENGEIQKEDIFDYIYDYIMEMDDETYENTIKPLYDSTMRSKEEDSVEMFRLFGPANMLLGETFKADTVCSRFGGCRMLLCNHFEGDNFDGDYEDIPYGLDTKGHWYTGKCEVCKRKILKPCYAVRLPGETGGWSGCFCSWDCVKSTDERRISYFERQLINDVESLLNDIGIQDREYLETEIEELLKS